MDSKGKIISFFPLYLKNSFHNIKGTKMKILSIFVVILFILTSCKENSTEPVTYGSIKGRVFDSKTNQPLGWVQISTTPPTSIIITDTNGNFWLTNVIPGDYKIRAEKYGYYTKELGVKVLGNKETLANFLLTKVEGTSSGNSENPNDTDTSQQNDIYLIAYFKFDGNVKDNSKYQLNGKEYLVRYVENRKGEINKAIEFLGTNQSYVDVPFTSFLNLSTFSYSFWINPNLGYGIADNSGHIDLISRWGHWGPNTTSFAFSLRQDGTFCILLYKLNNQNNYGASENYNFVYSTKKIEVGKWTHIVVTHNQLTGKTKIFINGELDVEKYTFTPQSSSVYGLRIGNRIDVTQTFYNGKMDDLRIYARELTNEEIKQLFEE